MRYTEKFKEFLFLAEIQIWIHLDSTVEFKINLHSMESCKKLNFLQEFIEKYSGIKDYVQYIWLPIFLKLSGPKPDPVLSKPLLSGHLLSNRHLPRSIHIYFFVKG